MKKQPKTNKSFYLILILIPFLFFIILEFSLRLFNYGVDTSTWINITDTHYGLNPDVARRYFYSVKNVPESIQDVFAIEKKPNTFRVFVLGGSSAAGYPFMPLGSFSRYIRQRLEQNYPEINIEVVNISLTAVNSYTIRDLIPDVLEQKPDLILIYAGHNEFYGALGIGSMESLGRSSTVVNFVLSLNKFKTTQLLRDFVKFIFSFLQSDKSSSSSTLMARMAQNQKIEYGSETFNLGIEQFEDNISDVFELVKNKNVPIIISTVASNLLDQQPFIYNKNKATKNAKLIFNQAKKEYELSNFEKADSLFRLAKDYDQLRFRAPEDINRSIKILGKKFDVPIIDSDSFLNGVSPNGIIGNNLMIDHLHLALEGYQDLGEFFYNKMNDLRLLPPSKPKFDYEQQDSITRVNFHFTELDISIAEIRIKLLKNDWPFTIHSKKKSVKSLIKLQNYIDSLAFDVVLEKETWEKSHRLLAATYLQRGDFLMGKKEIDLLIFQYPQIVEYNRFISEELLNRKKYMESLEYLERGNQLKPDQYFNKWLGIINLSQEKVDTAIYFLEQSLKFYNNDAQVLFNLSGAYSKKKEFTKALNLIERCLSLSPNYKSAIALRNQLVSIVQKK